MRRRALSLCGGSSSDVVVAVLDDIDAQPAARPAAPPGIRAAWSCRCRTSRPRPGPCPAARSVRDPVAGAPVIHDGRLGQQSFQHQSGRDFLAFVAQHLVDQQQAVGRIRANTCSRRKPPAASSRCTASRQFDAAVGRLSSRWRRWRAGGGRRCSAAPRLGGGPAPGWTAGAARRGGFGRAPRRRRRRRPLLAGAGAAAGGAGTALAPAARRRRPAHGWRHGRHGSGRSRRRRRATGTAGGAGWRHHDARRRRPPVRRRRRSADQQRLAVAARACRRRASGATARGWSGALPSWRSAWAFLRASRI